MPSTTNAYITAAERLPSRGGVILMRQFALGIVAGLFELLADTVSCTG